MSSILNIKQITAFRKAISKELMSIQSMYDAKILIGDLQLRDTQQHIWISESISSIGKCIVELCVLMYEKSLDLPSNGSGVYDRVKKKVKEDIEYAMNIVQKVTDDSKIIESCKIMLELLKED